MLHTNVVRGDFQGKKHVDWYIFGAMCHHVSHKEHSLVALFWKLYQAFFYECMISKITTFQEGQKTVYFLSGCE